MPKDYVDSEERTLADKSVRPMRDYQVWLSAARLKRTLLDDQIVASECDRKLAENALAQAKEQEAAIQKDITAAKEEVKEFTRQREVVAAYHKTLEQEVAALKAAAAQLIETNKAMAGQLAKLQLEAARRIDQRTRAMAQSGAGG
jgi:chromosome segregation ATPase